MATASVNRVYHGTLTASAVDTIDFNIQWAYVEVLNRGSVEIYVSTDGATNPTVAGNEFDVVPAGTAVQLPNRRQPTGETAGYPEVRLISSGTPNYSLTGGG